MTDEEKIKELNLARLRVYDLKLSIEKEMDDYSKRGSLWTHGRCKHWPEYEVAVGKLDTLRARFGT